jgi:heme/copper-type cytochrome/quinol oxidase subunit 2
MNQQTLATVILRILGLSYFYSSLAGFFSGNITMQAMSLNEAYGEEKIGVLTVMFSMIGVYFLFGLVLMIFAKPIAKLLFKENEKLNEEKTLSSRTLIEAAVPLVGLYFLITYFPGFITTAIEWYKEKAGPPTGMPPQYGMAMASSTIMIVVALFITLRSKTITQFLTRSTN